MTQCNMCGKCCENMPLNNTKKHLEKTIDWEDPSFDVVWRRWVRGWKAKGEKVTASRGHMIADYKNAVFIVKHWHGGKRGKPGCTTGWTCDQFNTKTRMCMAHDQRPPICSNYPWYNKVPKGPLDHAECSFWADLPKKERPEGWTRTPVAIRKRS